MQLVDGGRITGMFMDPVNFTAYEKLDWYEKSAFNIALLLACALVFLAVIPTSAFHFIRDCSPRGDRIPASRGAHLSNWIILGISLLNLVVVVGTALSALASMQMILIDPPLIVKIPLVVEVLSPVLTVCALVCTVPAWKEGYWRPSPTMRSSES